MKNLLRLAGAGAFTLLVLELFLRFAHSWLLPVAISNEVATGYHAGWTGIYDWIPEDHLFRMRPNYSREMSFNGYTWQHRTDSRGLRHPREIDSAPVVLLGDSMIYGHGVEQGDTVREQLEKILGVPVANLGVQRGSIHTAYQMLEDPGLSFAPRVAIFFFLKNDLHDLVQAFTQEEMFGVIRAAPGPLEVDYLVPRSRSGWELVGEKLGGFYTVRAVVTLVRLAYPSFGRAREAHAAEPLLWQSDQEQLAMAVHNEILRRLNRLAAANDIRLLHVFIETGYEAPRERMFKQILNSVCIEEGIPFLDLGVATGAAEALGVEPFLPRDGHFSADGARIVAEAIAEWIEVQRLDLQPRT